MRTHAATVIGRRHLSAHLVTVTLGGLTDFPTTGVPDEYIRVLIPPAGAGVVLPEIDEATWTITYPDGAAALIHRVYTISDHRVFDGEVQIDVDVALHDPGIGSDWARDCAVGSAVGLLEPRTLSTVPADAESQLLVADITGLPALARILRGLQPGQRAEAVVVLTDPADEIPLPSAGDVQVDWRVVEHEVDIADALTAAVTERDLPAGGSRFVWMAGEARASRDVRKHLRRDLGWTHDDFSTCGYWQVDAASKSRRYAQVADRVLAESEQARSAAGADEDAYLDALDDIYDKAGL